MHILIGALAGGTFAALAVVAMAVVTRKPVKMEHVLLAALGGAVAGAVTTATLGASTVAGATLARQAGAFALGGAAGGGVEQAADNVMNERPLHEGVVTSTAVGAGVGLVSLGGGKAFESVGKRVLPSVFAAGAPKTAVGEFIGSARPSTGSGLIRSGVIRSTLIGASAGRAPGTGAGVRRALEGEQPPVEVDEDAEVARERAELEPAAPRGPPRRGALQALGALGQ
ncbi:MAG TPA: hypothetical protein DEA08_32680 [Planctomycetes bacterium]|nr:hypothetical protein [Planctomycetota bacterium]